MSTDSPVTSLTLLERLRERDQTDAWARFIQLYSPLLHMWARRQGFQDADAADLTQEVLVKLMAVLPRYTRRDGQSFRGWLHQVTTNLCHDFRKRVATRRLPGAAGLSAVDADTPVVEIKEEEYRQSLVDSGLAVIRGEFEDRTWTAFEQVMLRRRKVTDVAAELGTTANAVYIARSRILARLREVIDEFLT